jgi:hypothetical protein
MTKQKEDKDGRRCPPRTETRRARRWASTLNIGASITWYGACTSCLNVALKEEQQKTKPAYMANFSIYTTAAASIVDPHFQALLATIGTALQGEDEEE